MRTAGAFIGSVVDKPERQIYNLEDYLFLRITCSSSHLRSKIVALKKTSFSLSNIKNCS